MPEQQIECKGCHSIWTVDPAKDYVIVAKLEECPLCAKDITKERG